MTITESIHNSVAILELDGRLDISEVENFENKLRELMDRKIFKIILDCNKLNFISSAGLRILIVIQKDLEPQNGEIAFFGFNTSTRKIFDITGYMNLFPVCENRLAALQRYGIS
jgi:anti-anti-sigma factor